MACRKACDWNTMRKEVNTKAFWRDLFAEFMATYILVSIQCVLPLTWGRESGFSDAVMTGLGMGFIVTTTAWTLGDFGGAHMNPAVTFAMMLSLKISIIKGFLYILLQIGGGVAGAAFASAITPTKYHDRLAVTSLGPDVSPWQGLLTEMWITYILVLTVFGSTNSVRKRGGAIIPPLFIGLAVALCIFAAWNHTGASMNPARSFGPALIKWIWKDHWVYWAGPMLGGALAAFVYLVVFDSIDRPKPENDIPDLNELKMKEYIGYRLAKKDDIRRSYIPLLLENRC